MALHLQSQQELVRILQIQLQQEQERLQDLTKISALAAELAPILGKYPADHTDFAEQLGLILPILPSPTPRVIEIVDGDRKDEQKNVVSDTKNSKYAKSSNCLDDNSLDNRIEIAQGAGKAKRVAVNAVQGLTHTEVLTDFHTLKSNDARAAFARTWLAKSSEALNETWSVIYELLKLVEEGELYKKESSLNNSKIYNSFQEYFQDTLKHPFDEWARLEANYSYISQYCPELYSALENTKQGDNNTETNFTQIEKCGNASTPPTSDTNTNDNNDINVIWYNSISGEVSVGSERRYFRILWNNKQNQHQVGLKKSESAKRWSKDINPTTQPLIDAVWQEFKAGKPDETEIILQKLCEAAEEVGGRFTEEIGGNVGKLGIFTPNWKEEYFGEEGVEVIELGYNDSSWWFIRPGHKKVYCSGDVHAFAEILKGLKTDVLAEQKSQFKAATITQIETAEPNQTQKTSSKPSDCWYTPPEIVELVELVLGKIDLDPCSDDGKHIPAKYHKTIREDGLACVWFGKVFINPPYSCPGKWIEKLLTEVNDSNVTEAIALLPASTDTKWFAPLWNQPICFWKGRIKFLDTNYQPKLPARQSHCLVYWGENTDKFNEVFSEFGEVKTSTNSQHTEVETTLPLIKKLEPLVSEKWVLEAIDNSQVMLYETDDKNSSDWVKITDKYESQGLFFISHETAFSNHAKTIEEAVERAAWWFDQTTIDTLDDCINILNGYNTDLIATRNNSTTAYIHQDKELFGTVFFKDDERLELPEREKQLLRDTYSIDIDNLIEDIQSQGEINPNDYLMGIGKLEVELNRADIIQNALHSLSSLNDLVIVRQRDIFKFYNDDRLENWLEENLGTIKIIDSEIVVDEKLNHLLLNQYSILVNQLVTDIINSKTEICSEDYIIDNSAIKELLIKETWNKQDLKTANNLLNKLVKSTPTWNELTETIRHQHHKILENDADDTDDNDNNDGSSITPTPSPKNPNNNGSQTIESTKEELDTLFSAIQSYQTDLNIQKDHNKLTFYQQKYRLGSVEQNPNKLVAEEGLISNLKISYGIDIKGLIESIEFASLDNCFELDPFEHIGKSNPAIFIPGCVVTPTWEKGRGLQGVLQLVNGQIATIRWLNSLDHGDNVPEQVNIGLLRYIAAQQTAKNDSLHTETLSDEPTAENLAALKFGGLIAATTVNNTNTNKENSEVVENTTASSFPDDNEDLIWEDLTWMDAIKVKLEKLEGFTVSHDEVDLTAWHYGTEVGSIHHNEEDELEIEQKLIGELAKYNFDLEAFLVNLNIPYKFYHLKPVVITPTTDRSDLQTSEQESSSEQKMTKKPPVEELNYQVNGKSISFGLTLPQLLSEQKTVTRRMWKDSYAKRFLNDWNARPGEFLYPALTKSYRVGGKQVGYIKLTHQPYQEKLADIPTSDLAAEGFPELSRAEFINKFFDGNDQQIAWVIRFNFIPNKEKPENNAEQIGENSPLPLDLLDQLTAVFDGLESIRTSRSGNVLWFYRGSENLYPCSMKTFDDNTSTLFPTVKLNDKMKELYGIDIDRVCYDLETGKEVDINNYIDHSVLEQTIKDSHKNNDTITWQDLLNNAAYLDITDSQTSDELNTSTTTEQSQTNTEEHPERLHWLKDTSMFNRSETYIVWNGTQKCGKINLCNKSKNKAGFGKWYVSPNVFGPYYDTIEKAATACWQDFISQNAEQTATQEDLIPF